MFKGYLTIVIWILLPFIVAFVIQRFVNRKKYRILESLISIFSGRISYFFMPKLIGSYQGSGFTISFTPAGKSSPPYVNFYLLFPVSFKITLTRENPIERFMKKLRLVRDIEINIPEFDKRYMIWANDKTRAQYFLSIDEIRDSINTIFELGFDSLSASRKGIKIIKPDYNLDTDLLRERVVKILDILLIIANRARQMG